MDAEDGRYQAAVGCLLGFVLAAAPIAALIGPRPTLVSYAIILLVFAGATVLVRARGSRW
jgi:predicted tellurium resistance membrane protein TerC